MNYFSGCQSIEEAKTLYRELLKANHPDLGGSEEETKKIIASFEVFCRNYMNSAFSDYADSTGNSVHADSDFFGDILAKILSFNIRVEVIGYWIYAFESYEYRNELKELGFWFSGKHKAWVYSGTVKSKYRTRMNLDQIRTHHGYELIKEKEERLSITANV